MQYEYNVVQFTAQFKTGLLGTKGDPIETQFQKFINGNTIDSWEFYRMDTVHAYVKAGCIASIFGSKDEVIYQDVVIFRKEKK